MASKTRTRPRKREIALRIVYGVGLGTLFTASVVAGLALHVNLPASRRLVASQLAGSLSGTFYGTVTLGSIEHLGPRGATLTELTVTDEAGNQVLVLRDVRVRTDAFALLRDVVFAEDKVNVIVRHIRADRAEVLIVPDPVTGVPTIARALTPVPKPKKLPEEPSKPSKPVRVYLPSIDIAKVDARGTVAGLPTLEVSLGAVRGSVLVTPKGAAVDVFRYGVVVRGLGGTDATGTGELHVRAPGAVWGSYDGFFGNLPVSASYQVKGQDVTATLDVPKGMPEDVKLLLPDWPLQRSVSAHVEASGKLPELRANAKFEVEGGARIAANGPIRFGRDFGIELDVQGRGVDIRALWPKAPATSVDIDTALEIYTKDQKVVVDANGTTAPTRLLNQPVPPIDVSGTFNHEGFKGKATLHEPGMPLKVAIDVKPNGAVDLDVRAPSFQLDKAPRVEKLTAAKGRAEITAKAHIEKNRLDATMVADVSGFELGDLALRHARVSGKASGPLDDPKKLDIDAKLQGRKLEANGMAFEGVKATATGLVTRPRLTAKLTDDTNPNIDAKGILETGANPGVRNVSVQVEREGVTIGGKVSRLDFDSRDVRLDEIRLVGAGGELVGAARVAPSRIEVKAKGDGIDLDRVTRALRLPRGLLGGRLNVDADFVASKGESHGYVRVGLGKGSIYSVGGVALSFDARLDGEKVEGKGQATVEDFGRLGASFSGKLDGPANDPRSWQGIVGQTEVQLSDLELSWLARVLPDSARIEKIGGTAFARLKIERTEPKLLPNISVDLAGTRKLEIVRSGATKKDPPVVIKGIEIVANGAINGEKGDTGGTTALFDEYGRLFTASGSTRLDFKKLIADPDWLAQLGEAPLSFGLTLHERPFSELPEPIRPAELEGTIGARLDGTGTLATLRLQPEVRISNLRTTKSPTSVPVNVEARGEYDVETERYAANVQLLTGPVRVGRLIASGTASLDGSWTGGGQLALEGIPLAVVPQLADSRVEGRLEGAVVLQRNKPDAPPRMTANVQLTQVSVDRTPLGGGHFMGAFDGQQVKASLTMKDQTGEVSADVRAAADWTEALPKLQEGKPVRVDVAARDYDAAVLSPFLRDLFSRLTGKVDGKLSLVLEPKPKAEGDEGSDWRSRIEGSATVTGGVIQIAELGLELTDVSFRASAREAGPYAVIELNDIEGKARSEKPSLKAWARLYLEGVRVRRGEGAISIGELPLLLQGVTLATASKGLATLELEREEDAMKVTVDVSQLTAKLPESSGRSVVDLGDNPTIEVSQALREPRPPRTGEILPWRFVFRLGRDVKLIRSDMSLPLTGQPMVELAKKTKVSGFVELEPGGRFQYLGKSFAVETGRVTFDTDDASNPHIAAVAGWRGPDGTVVYADVRGTLKEAKVTVTSDPPRPEPEIMALLFGGSSATTASTDEGQGSRGRESSAAASGVLAQAFNTIFAEPLSSAPVQVELRTATNEDKASYTAAVQVAENIWFEGTYRNRLEAQQEAASTEPVDVSGTIDWRFRRNWSLRTEVGTLGTGLDLLFQYRY